MLLLPQITSIREINVGGEVVGAEVRVAGSWYYVSALRMCVPSGRFGGDGRDQLKCGSVANPAGWCCEHGVYVRPQEMTAVEIPAAEEGDTFAMFLREGDGWRQFGLLGAQGAAYSLREGTGELVAQNMRTGARYTNGRRGA